MLVEDADGDVWDLDYPVCMVDWWSAVAYARWEAARTGLPWRLPGELEWEKAARGADGRRFPWGDFLDPSWCCIRSSHPGRPLPAVAGAFEGDISPYGVRDLAGNMRDWCVDPWVAEGHERSVGELWAEVPDGPDYAAQEIPRVLRGGSWFFVATSARCASRYGLGAENRSDNIGFRLVRPLRA